MHRSRLSTLLIDCDEAAFEGAVKFWSEALGKEAIAIEDPRYVSLRGRVGAGGGLYVVLQKVPPEERAIHLDIEADDVEAEVKRLELLGARVKARVRRHVVMTAPSGHTFCVVPVYRKDFPEKAAEWTH